MKIGDYVRINKGIIGKIKAIDNQTELEDLYLVKRRWYYKEDIIKSSPNIIDLIEVGDYVNGKRVNFVYSPDGKQVFRIEFDVDVLKGHMICESKHIKSIVTKQQFSQMEYKINE